MQPSQESGIRDTTSDRRSDGGRRDRNVDRDLLTGVPWFQSIFADFRRRGNHGVPAPFAVALVQFVGVDRTNDVHGYAAGDGLLQRIARQLDRAIRADFAGNGLVARVHGARFAVMLSGADAAERIGIEMRAIAAELVKTLSVSTDATLGIRLSSGMVADDETIEAVLARLAKKLSAPRALVRQLDVEAAIRDGQIIVQYQPQFLLADDSLTGAEALARWRHPTLGDLGGAALFAAAHQAGQQIELSTHVWQLVFAQMAAWPQSTMKLRIALNVTASDLGDPAGATRILQLAARYGIAPARLCVEVTEGAALVHPQAAAASLLALRNTGIRIALDDFGTGHSGLAWLKNLPVDYIKIDSAFAADVGGSDRDEAVLRGVIQLANDLGLDVLAEGVETIDQRDRLTALGCRWYQGFLKAAAMPGDDLVRLALQTNAR